MDVTYYEAALRILCERTHSFDDSLNYKEILEWIEIRGLIKVEDYEQGIGTLATALSTLAGTAISHKDNPHFANPHVKSREKYCWNDDLNFEQRRYEPLLHYWYEHPACE